MLTGMCVPDLRGTQGTFSFFTTGFASGVDEPAMGYGGDDAQGVVTKVSRDGDLVRGEIIGPMNTVKEGAGEARMPFTAKILKSGDQVRLVVDKHKFDLPLRTFSPWIRLTFKLAPGVAAVGLVRFYATSIEPEFGLYMPPIHIDPEKPSLPISHPYV